MTTPSANSLEKADLVLQNGSICTLERERPWATALAIASGTLIRVGSNEDVRKFVGEHTEVIDLNGRFAMPGFNDSHIHFHPSMLDKLSRFGITTIQDITAAEQIPIYVKLAEERLLTFRLLLRPPLQNWRDYPLYCKMTEPFANMLKVVGLKGYIDGMFREHTAFLLQAYTDLPTTCWSLSRMAVDHSAFAAMISGALSLDAAVSVHAIGDAGVRVLLDHYEKSIAMFGLGKHRLRVVHASLLAPSDFKRFGELRLFAEVNPAHTRAIPWLRNRIGPERVRWAFAFRSLKANGARLLFGSDYPGPGSTEEFPLNPLLGIQGAVARKGLGDNEVLTVWEALEAYTITPAVACGEGAVKGTLTEGKLADIVVLSESPFDVPASALSRIRAVCTIVGGRVSFREPRL